MQLDAYRVLTPQLLDAVEDFLQDCEAQAGYRSFGDAEWRVRQLGHDSQAFCVIAQDDANENILGYTWVEIEQRSANARVICRAWGQYAHDDIEAALRQVTQVTAQTIDCNRLEWWTTQPDDRSSPLPQTLGLRTMFQLHCGLPLDATMRRLDDNLVMRSFVIGRDEDAWLDINRRAFADHPSQGTWSRPHFDAKLAEQWVDVDGIRIAESDGQITGFCWTKMHALAKVATGEIFVIAVDPVIAGHGLGRQLFLDGAEYLSQQGAQRLILFVESNNAQALALYRSLGLATLSIETCLVIDL